MGHNKLEFSSSKNVTKVIKVSHNDTSRFTIQKVGKVMDPVMAAEVAGME